MSLMAPVSELAVEHEALLSFLYMCPVGLIQVTGGGAITMINPHAMSLLMPIARHPVIENLFDALESHAPELMARVQDFVGTSGPVLQGHRIHLPPTGPNQGPYVLSCTVLMINRNCLMVVLQDVSRDAALQTSSEAARRQAVANDRLVALGTMAGGLAHEINNPVAIIHALIEDLAETAARGEAGSGEVATVAAEVLSVCKRIERIIRDLLRLARDGARDPFAPAALAEIVNRAAGVCEGFFRQGAVELVAGRIDPSITFSCREVQIGQILVNLLQNAFYAAKAAGGAPRVRVEARRHGADVEIRVMDSGRGVPPALRERIMEPFFTTKPVGEGTGLGLSLAGEIARAHGGRISLDDSQAETCFVLTLPALRDASHDPR